MHSGSTRQRRPHPCLRQGKLGSPAEVRLTQEVLPHAFVLNRTGLVCPATSYAAISSDGSAKK